MGKPTRYNKRNEDAWSAAKLQTWEKLRTLRGVIADPSVKEIKEKPKMSHHDKKKKPKKSKPKPKKGY